jgi:hypothetical protein
MQQYEFKSVRRTFDLIAQECNKLGAEGWYAVGMAPAASGVITTVSKWCDS